MESPQCKLSARLTDTLRSDNAYSRTDSYQSSSGKVSPVAVLADTPPGMTAKRRAHVHLGDTTVSNSLGPILIDLFIPANDDLTRALVNYINRSQTSEQTVAKG